MRRAITLLAVALIAMIGSAAPAYTVPEEPRAIVQRLNDALLYVMQNAAQLQFQGRYDYLAPILDETFSFAEMARISTGQYWPRLSPERQTELAARFRQMSITTFAARFDGYSGERFETLGTEDTVRGGVLVLSRIVKGSDETVPLNYVFTQIEGNWRAIDVYLEGTVSELAIYRSEFVSVLNREGYEGLIRRIDEKIARLKG